MTEKELRQHFVDVACSYLGYKEADGSHKKIVDIYNSHKPLARGYKLSYNDSWCAGYVSAMAIMCELTDIIFTEVGCEAMINLFKKAGRWQENDAYVPQIGDIVMYDWGDSGAGDNTGFADHVGIVVAVNGKALRIIEGNTSDKVGYRNLNVNGRYIRGYCLPDFAKKATSVDTLSTDLPAGIIIPDKPKTETIKTVTVTLPQISTGFTGNAVKSMQLMLIGNGYSCGIDGADGDFGNNTKKALVAYQTAKGLTPDGICGAKTWSMLLN